MALVLTGFRTVVIQRRIWHRIVAAGSEKKASAARAVIVLGFNVSACICRFRILEAEEWTSIARLLNMTWHLTSSALCVVKDIDDQCHDSTTVAS